MHAWTCLSFLCIIYFGCNKNTLFLFCSQSCIVITTNLRQVKISNHITLPLKKTLSHLFTLQYMESKRILPKSIFKSSPCPFSIHVFLKNKLVSKSISYYPFLIYWQLTNSPASYIKMRVAFVARVAFPRVVFF